MKCCELRKKRFYYHATHRFWKKRKLVFICGQILMISDISLNNETRKFVVYWMTTCYNIVSKVVRNEDGLVNKDIFILFSLFMDFYHISNFSRIKKNNCKILTASWSNSETVILLSIFDLYYQQSLTEKKRMKVKRWNYKYTRIHLS